MHLFKQFALYATLLSGQVLPALAGNLTTQLCQGQAANITTKYPNRCQIAKLFNDLAENNFDAFFGKVSPTVHWTLMGTHPLAGIYTNRTILLTNAILRLDAAIDSTKPTSLNLVHIVGGGDEAWSSQELHALATCKNGMIYDNRFSWLTRWTTDGVIDQVHAYFDSAPVQRVITDYESGVYNYTSPRTTLQEGPVGLNCQAGI